MVELSVEALHECQASFVWCWGQDFFVETKEFGNFHWKDPDYSGDNTMTPFDGDCKAFCKSLNIDFGRDKGRKLISEFCGKDFVLVI